MHARTHARAPRVHVHTHTHTRTVAGHSGSILIPLEIILHPPVPTIHEAKVRPAMEHVEINRASLCKDILYGL